MKLNLIAFAFIGLFLISLASAEVNNYAPVKQNDCVTLKQTCASCTYVNVSVSYPNSTLAISNQAMSSQGAGVWTYDFCNTSLLGRYDVNGEGDLEGTATGFSVLYFDVTYLGKELDQGSATLYLGFLAILILIFVVNFVGMGFLPGKNKRDDEGRILSVNYLKYFRNVLWMTGYFLFIGIVYIASNLAFAFLKEDLIAETLFMIFKISLGAAPIVIVVWIIWMFASIIHDRNLSKLLNRGIFPGSRI